jgi:hypothetical protein
MGERLDQPPLAALQADRLVVERVQGTVGVAGLERPVAGRGERLEDRVEDRGAAPPRSRNRR